MRKTYAGLLYFILLSFLLTASLFADSFEIYGLKPAVIIIKDDELATYRTVFDIVKDAGARGMICHPPGLIYGRFSPATTGSDLEGLMVEIIWEGDDFSRGSIDDGAWTIADRLLNGEKYQDLAAPAENAEPFKGIVLRVSDDMREKFSGAPGPRTGSPAEILDRGIDQNSEFMMGNVLINVVIPESNGSIEDWTETEIHNLWADIDLGLSQYINQTHWVELNYIINTDIAYPVPIASEPIMNNMETDYIWINESLEYLYNQGHFDGFGVNEEGNAHLLNNATREKWIDDGFRIDWVFTVFMADASYNGCWLTDEGYTAYAMLGGPYMVVPYPACRFGTGIHFAHVFIHEMSHVFWALDEYVTINPLTGRETGTPCTATSGYLKVANGNSYLSRCGEGLSCIMNNATLSNPLPICYHTMGQVGLRDINDNNAPDLYEIAPVLEVISRPDVLSDTTYSGNHVVSMKATNEAIPNQNPFQSALTRINYAPYIKEGWMQINNSIILPIHPSDGRWDQSTEFITHFIDSGLEPGDNWIYFRVANVAGITAIDSVFVTYIGLKYYTRSLRPRPDHVEIRWSTADEIFGSDFEIYREDVNTGISDRLLIVVDGEGYDSQEGGYNQYSYIDEEIDPGNCYRYHILGRTYQYVAGSEPIEYQHDTGILTTVTPIAVTEGIISPIVPNPMVGSSGKIFFTIKIPGDFDSDLTSRGGSGGRDNLDSGSSADMTFLDIKIYNVKGQRVRHLFSLPLPAGQYKNIEWDGLDDRGAPVSSGVYFMKVKVAGKDQTKKIVVLR
ncbi:MAG: T9SS type A sorting domain-containing protein [Candidatus Krumholzibacteriota bacterium]|nr:T9SS type A sorting domain-containing protein [Candidatus Krumholzibacteriota bacterium]